MGTLLLGLLAGTLTTLSPCVLPILPIVLLGALDQHRLGPLAFAGGLVTTFTALGVLLAGAGTAFGVSSDTIRVFAAILMVAVGAVLLSSMLQQRFAALGASVTGSLGPVLERFAPNGLGGQFVLGALMGAIWTPCSGPTLGAAVTLAANSETAINAGLILLFFGIGACIPLVAIAYGSQQTLRSRRDLMLRLGQATKPVLGVVMLLGGMAILSGLDKLLEAAIVNVMPDWLVLLTSRF